MSARLTKLEMGWKVIAEQDRILKSQGSYVLISNQIVRDTNVMMEAGSIETALANCEEAMSSVIGALNKSKEKITGQGKLTYEIKAGLDTNCGFTPRQGRNNRPASSCLPKRASDLSLNRRKPQHERDHASLSGDEEIEQDRH